MKQEQNPKFAILLEKDNPDSEIFYGTLEQYCDCLSYCESIEQVQYITEYDGHHFVWGDPQQKLK
jgi:hypothetical protein